MIEIERPNVSVVVASFSGEQALDCCLESLESQPQAVAIGETVELIVATCIESTALSRLQKRHPEVVFIAVPPPTDVFELRSVGVARARGQLVALTEDHVTVSRRWLEALRAAHGAGRGVAGGPVDHGGGGWALFFCEYGLYMPPVGEGPVPTLSGVNAGYDRELLMGCRSTWEHGFHENEVHDALRAAGHELYLVPEASIESHLEMSFSAAARHLFSGGRQFAGYQESRSPRRVAIFRALASPAVPMVLLWRIFRRVARRRPRRLGRLLRVLPALVGLLSAWSAGEACGYLGPAPAAAVTEEP
ncbi:MAG: hypothetical protein V3T72_16275 [Thermoanaerobaculia bacterium]